MPIINCKNPIWVVSIIRCFDQKLLWERNVIKPTKGEAIAFGWDAVNVILVSPPFPGEIKVTAEKV